jgi:hypothetical protein
VTNNTLTAAGNAMGGMDKVRHGDRQTERERVTNGGYISEALWARGPSVSLPVIYQKTSRHKFTERGDEPFQNISNIYTLPVYNMPCTKFIYILGGMRINRFQLWGDLWTKRTKVMHLHWISIIHTCLLRKLILKIVLHPSAIHTIFDLIVFRRFLKLCDLAHSVIKCRGFRLQLSPPLWQTSIAPKDFIIIARFSENLADFFYWFLSLWPWDLRISKCFGARNIQFV